MMPDFLAWIGNFDGLGVELASFWNDPDQTNICSGRAAGSTDLLIAGAAHVRLPEWIQ
jgi:hypothetical protein